MTRLMIVDDDENIRTGLRHIFDWDELGIEIVGEADGGHAAFELYQTLHPHIVITDIRMPSGNGLELIENIRSTPSVARVIVLSGYDDFEYVRQAMKMQVEDYLLKPIDANELKQIVTLCCEQLTTQWFEEQLKRETFQLLKNNVLNRWVENRIDGDQLQDKFNFLGFDFRDMNRYQACVIAWRNPREHKLTGAEEHFRSFAIHNAIDEALTTEKTGFAFINSDRQVVCVFTSRGHDEQAFSMRNQAWMTEKASHMASALKTPWFCTLGPVCQQYEQVHNSYKEALHLQHYLTYTDPIICTDSSMLDLLRNSEDALPSSMNQETIVRSLVSANNREWFDDLSQDWVWAHLQSDPTGAAKYVAMEWVVLAKQAIKLSKYPVDEALLENRLFTNIMGYDSLHEVKSQLFELLEEVEEKIHQHAGERKNMLVEQVEAYLKEHYREEMTLQILAAKFFINNIYLGRKFKEETGELFSDYLNRLRFEKPKELLKETHMKASDIALQVGFSDPNYFFRKFKQQFGVSPSDYRNNGI